MLTRVHPGAPETLDLDAAATRDRLLELYRPDSADWLRLNLVTSVSGGAAGSDGTSETLTSATDRRVLGVIRELSDVVLVGAASVRVEGYQLPRRSRLAVVTSSGDLGGHRFGTENAEPVVVVCPASAVDRVRETLPDPEIITVPDSAGSLAMADLVAALRGVGFRSIVCEGGPSLATQLVEAGLADELCLTTSPRLGAVTLAAFGRDAFAERPLTLTQLIVDGASGLFARWAIGAPAANSR